MFTEKQPSQCITFLGFPSPPTNWDELLFANFVKFQVSWGSYTHFFANCACALVISYCTLSVNKTPCGFVWDEKHMLARSALCIKYIWFTFHLVCMCVFLLCKFYENCRIVVGYRLPRRNPWVCVLVWLSDRMSSLKLGIVNEEVYYISTTLESKRLKVMHMIICGYLVSNDGFHTTFSLAI